MHTIIKMMKNHLIWIVPGLALILFLVLKTFILDISQVQGNSMEPNLHKNQMIFINRVAYGLLIPIINKYLIKWESPKVGEVLIIKDPREEKTLVKRCVAKTGDKWKISGGYLIIGDCSYPLRQYSYLLLKNTRTVPKNHVLVVGDNYEDSIDSRTFGFIKYDDILGRVIGAFHKPCGQ